MFILSLWVVRALGSRALSEPSAGILGCAKRKHDLSTGPAIGEASTDSRKTHQCALRPLVHHRENHNKPCTLGVGGVQRDAGFMAKEDGFRQP